MVTIFIIIIIITTIVVIDILFYCYIIIYSFEIRFNHETFIRVEKK